MNVYRVSDADHRKIHATAPINALLKDIACKREPGGTWQMVFSHHIAAMLMQRYGIEATYVCPGSDFEPG